MARPGSGWVAARESIVASTLRSAGAIVCGAAARVENAGTTDGVSRAIVWLTSCAACTAASGTSGEYGSRAMAVDESGTGPRATDSDGATYSYSAEGTLCARAGGT